MVNSRIGQPELLKQINQQRVLEILANRRVVSRAELAKTTGLSRATISLLADRLLQEGIVVEEGFGSSSGGRPPVLLHYQPDAALAMGAQMHDYDWTIFVTNLDAQPVEKLERHIPDSSPETAVHVLRDGVEELRSRIDPSLLLPAIGIGTPGLVDIRSGVIKSAVDIGWFDVPMRELVERETGLRALVANRSKVGALTELWYGGDPPPKDIIYISIGTGVAAGIIHRGELYLGANSSAGEIGHMTIIPDGPACPCGNHGCLQQLISEQALTARARRLMREEDESSLLRITGHHPERLSAPELLREAEAGDALAVRVLDEAAEYLALAVGNLVNLFNPELIVLGGPVGIASPLLLTLLREKVKKRAMAYPLSGLSLRACSFGIDTGAIGASVLVLQQASEMLFSEAGTPAALGETVTGVPHSPEGAAPAAD
jgi:glucokinase-like ROK family protein